MQIICDILVIGAGPAGSTAAKSAAKAGVKVILIEKRKKIGIPVQCAEYLPYQITQEIKLSKDVIAQQIDFMQTYTPDSEVVETQAKGFIIYRELFDQALAKLAIVAGVEIFLQTTALSYEDGTVKAMHGNQTLQIIPKVIIGADGPYSIVGKWIDSINQDFIYAAQYQMKLCNGFNSTLVYFCQDIPCGYGWVFPKKDIANVGVGVDLQFGIKPIEALQKFVKYLHKKGIIKLEIINTTGGAIPVGGLVKKLHHKNIILVGDAAGMVHPITGAGVSNAILCGKIAGEIAAEAVLKNNLDKLAEYEDECRMLLGNSLIRAVKKRKTLTKHWNSTDEELIKTIRSTWIAFEEYYT
jgi:geranylgeranyl reductase family protein